MRIGSRRVVLARTEQGYVAFDDRCTHKGGPLSDGVLACSTVQCPWHGSQFDVRTGAVKHGPAEQRIATYPVEERGGRVWLRLPAGEHAEYADARQDQSVSTRSNATRSSTLTAPSR